MRAARTGSLVALAAAIALSFAGCGGSGDAAAHRAVTSEVDEPLPAVTVQDWRTYADHLVSVHEVAEKELGMSAEEKQAGEGLIGRVATLHVDEVLWSRPHAPSLPNTLDFQVAGWEYKDGHRLEMVTRGSPRIEKGHEYLVAVTKYPPRFHFGASGWAPLSVTAVLPYDGHTIGQGPDVGGKPDTAATNPVWGRPGSQLAEALRQTEPDPAAVPYMGRDPVARYAASRSSQSG